MLQLLTITKLLPFTYCLSFISALIVKRIWQFCSSSMDKVVDICTKAYNEFYQQEVTFKLRENEIYTKQCEKRKLRFLQLPNQPDMKIMILRCDFLKFDIEVNYNVIRPPPPFVENFYLARGDLKDSFFILKDIDEKLVITEEVKSNSFTLEDLKIHSARRNEETDDDFNAEDNWCKQQAIEGTSTSCFTFDDVSEIKKIVTLRGYITDIKGLTSDFKYGFIPVHALPVDRIKSLPILVPQELKKISKDIKTIPYDLADLALMRKLSNKLKIRRNLSQ